MPEKGKLMLLACKRGVSSFDRYKWSSEDPLIDILEFIFVCHLKFSIYFVMCQLTRIICEPRKFFVLFFIGIKLGLSEVNISRNILYQMYQIKFRNFKNALFWHKFKARFLFLKLLSFCLKKPL